MESVQSAIQDKPSYLSQAPAIIDQIKAQNMELTQAAIDLGVKLIAEGKGNVIQKFLILRMLKDCTLAKCGKIINGLANNKQLLSGIEEVCMHDAGNQDENRGKTLFKSSDPQTSSQYLKLALLFVQYLAQTYPHDSRKNPTKFNSLYQSLIERKYKQVAFPQNSDLMQPLKKVLVNQVSQSNFQDSSIKSSQFQQDQQTFQQKLIQEQKSSQMNQNEKNRCMEQLNKLKIQIMEDVEMINDTLREADGEMEYVNDVLQTYQESFQVQRNEFQKSFEEALGYQDTLSDNEIENISNINDFLHQFPSLYLAYISTGCTKQAFNALKKTTLNMIEKIYGKEYNVTPQDKDQMELQKQKEQIDKLQQSQQNQEKKEYERYQKQDREREQKQKEKEEKARQELERQQQLELQRLQADRQEKERQEREKQERERRERQEKERQEREKQEREKKEREREQREQRELEKRSRDQQKKQQQDKDIQLKMFMSSQPQESQQYQQSSQYFQEDNYQQLNPYSQKQQSFGRNSNQLQSSFVKGDQRDSEFLERFEQMSQSSASLIHFPFANFPQLPEKQKRTGKEILHNDNQFQVFQGMTEQVIKRFKLCSLKKKGALIDSREFQIGCVTSLHFDSVKQKSYLRVNQFFGNKSNQRFNDLQVQYKADNNSIVMWVKPINLNQVIESGNQEKQEILVIYKNANYTLIKGYIQQIEWVVPCSLISFMDFKEINGSIFRAKWRGKKSQVIKSQSFLLNSSITKSPAQLIKYFPQTCELISYQKFTEQKIQWTDDIRDIKYLNYKLGGIFELSEANNEYLIKIIIMPNMRCVVQLIPLFKNVELAEQLINTLVWFLGV